MADFNYNFGRGTEGGAGGGTLIAYGEITNFGNIGAIPAGLTVVGDFTAVGSNPGDGSTATCTFNTPLDDDNYNVMFEIISKGTLANDNSLNAPVVVSKSTTGFVFNIDEEGGSIQDLQINVRIESTIPNLTADFEFITLSGTTQTGDESSLTHSLLGTASTSNDYNYDLTKWIGNGYSISKVRSAYIKCVVFSEPSPVGVEYAVRAKYPDDTTFRNIASSNSVDSNDDTWFQIIAQVPINPGQTNLELQLDTIGGGNNSFVEFEIIGVTQVAVSSSGAAGGLYARAFFTVSGGVITPGNSTGFSSISRASLGNYDFVFDTSTSDTSYTALLSLDGIYGTNIHATFYNRTINGFSVNLTQDSVGPVDPAGLNVTVFN